MLLQFARPWRLRILLTCGLALTSAVLLLNHYPPPVASSEFRQPDVVIEQINSVNTDVNGHISMQMSATNMAHYANSDYNEITQPLLTIYQKNRDPLRISAKKAYSWQGMQKINLIGEVVVQQNLDTIHESSKLLTDKLWLFPEQKIATTQEVVVIKQPGVTITAKGLHADLQSNVVKLISAVKGDYVLSNSA